MSKDRLSTDQLAQRLGVSPRLLRYWRKNNTGPKWGRYGARVEYIVSDVETWESERAAARLEHYNTRQLAELLDLSETTIVMWRWQGKGPHYEKNGKFVTYPIESTKQWAKENGYEIK